MVRFVIPVPKLGGKKLLLNLRIFQDPKLPKNQFWTKNNILWISKSNYIIILAYIWSKYKKLALKNPKIDWLKNDQIL